MEIHIYDRNLYRKGTIENHTSLQWHRKYYDCGTFELHAPVTDRNLDLLQSGNVITIGNKKEAAIIRGDQSEEESTLVNEIVRNGYFLPVYLSDRLTGSLFNYSGTVEDAMRYMINRAEAIPLLHIANGIGEQTKIEFQATYKNLLSYIGKLARYAEIGFRIVPDFKKKIMTFETYKGIDRTQAQGKNPRVIFSEGYENLNQAKHNYSDEGYITKVVVGGAGEGTNRIYVTVGGGSGFNLREAFLDAKDINQEDLTEDQYLAALRTRGEEFLAEHGIFENFEAEVQADVNFTYGKDYDLGDIVTVKKKNWGKSQNLRITEICEVYEYGGMYVVPTFGDALPTSINWDD
ncbi:MAG: siphovirus ReqiPepy6 Gp37-like family protein [Lachnospiraceae bacterium]|nr:siphovirus ReqiPepy6 Gp37-like family protein [Lachnospiraceae bacterium]